VTQNQDSENKAIGNIPRGSESCYATVPDTNKAADIDRLSLIDNSVGYAPLLI
jgi:hypothetical protein